MKYKYKYEYKYGYFESRYSDTSAFQTGGLLYIYTWVSEGLVSRPKEAETSRSPYGRKPGTSGFIVD